MYCLLMLLIALSASWNTDVSTDPIDDSRVITLYSPSISGVNKYGERMNLCLRITEFDREVDDVDIYVTECGYLGSDRVSVTSRLDSEEPETASWSISTSGTGMFCPSNTEHLLMQLINGTEYVIRFTPYSDNRRTIAFSLIGLTNAISRNLSNYSDFTSSIEASLARTALFSQMNDYRNRERAGSSISVNDLLMVDDENYVVRNIDYQQERILIAPVGNNTDSSSEWIGIRYEGIIISDQESMTYEIHLPVNPDTLLFDGEKHLINEISVERDRVRLYPVDDTNYTRPREGFWTSFDSEKIELIYEIEVE